MKRSELEEIKDKLILEITKGFETDEEYPINRIVGEFAKEYSLFPVMSELDDKDEETLIFLADGLDSPDMKIPCICIYIGPEDTGIAIIEKPEEFMLSFDKTVYEE